MTIIKKTNKSFERKHVKGTKIFQREKKTKSDNMLVSDIEIFLKQKKERSVNMVVNDTKVFYKMSIEQIFLECKK